MTISLNIGFQGIIYWWVYKPNIYFDTFQKALRFFSTNENRTSEKKKTSKTTPKQIKNTEHNESTFDLAIQKSPENGQIKWEGHASKKHINDIIKGVGSFFSEGR